MPIIRQLASQVFIDIKIGTNEIAGKAFLRMPASSTEH